jgi:hypothetical protein
LLGSFAPPSLDLNQTPDVLFFYSLCGAAKYWLEGRMSARQWRR